MAKDIPISPSPDRWECRVMSHPECIDASPMMSMATSVDLCRPEQTGCAFDPNDQNTFEETLSRIHAFAPTPRIDCISRRFLDLPFLLDATGEGEGASIDTDPMFRFDGHDCVTFIEHVMALSLSTTFSDFQEALTTIRYHEDGRGIYGGRLHFFSADWMATNEMRGFVQDVTSWVGEDKTETIRSTIDRAKWIGQRTDLTIDQKTEIFKQFDRLELMEPEATAVEIIPMSAWFVDGQHRILNEEMVARLPEASILAFALPESRAHAAGVIISHVALLLAPNGDQEKACLEPVIRHGTIRSKRDTIYEEKLSDYLSSQAPYRAGVAILEILDREKKTEEER